ncbi:AT-rich interactive domain-containing protein 4B-like isoform X2 [Oppia nitens]|uniref:AT-rich interactive domain-containing protein 4B-like isoform X2 n=1 Tax=Oppia nitens TaxID=1686743 RepID=UPI0023DC4653|nr:AT-rich interactive domain-containing protein 4B-like isoform X2 [Oppia nitens]
MSKSSKQSPQTSLTGGNGGQSGGSGGGGAGGGGHHHHQQVGGHHSLTATAAALTDEPSVLPIGTDVSAKYKGAFCEAKIKKIIRNVKCKLTVKSSGQTATVDDDSIVTGALRVGAIVTAKTTPGGQPVEAVVNKILDQSFYTVVFDDGDEATLKRNSLCLKSGKHFAESETLDQLPLTNPEHFGRRRRRRPPTSDSDDDEPEAEETESSQSPPEKDSDDSDDEQSEEKDRFVAQLYKYMDERGTPINRAPTVGGRDLNLYKLYRIVVKMGGYNRVTNKSSWRAVYTKLGLAGNPTTTGKESNAVLQLKTAFKKYLLAFDDFYRKLGCTITVNSRTSRPSRGERSLREEKPAPSVSLTTKKSIKKERESKKDDQKEDTEAARDKDTVTTGAASSHGAGDGVSISERNSKGKDRGEATKGGDDGKGDDNGGGGGSRSGSKVVTVKEEKDSKKPDDTIDNDRRQQRSSRGRNKKIKEEINEEPPPAAPASVVDEDTMTGQSTVDDSDEDEKDSGKNSKSIDESTIKVDDRLKVKYGRGRQLKVYEAKVLKIELDPIKNRKKYFVHYSGWNARYDEWIKKSRIVQVVRDRSPRRRSAKINKKGESIKEVAVVSSEQPSKVTTTTTTTAAQSTAAAVVTSSTAGQQSQRQSASSPAPAPPVASSSSSAPLLQSQSSVSSIHSNDSSVADTSSTISTATAAAAPVKQLSSAKRGRPPNTVKTNKQEVTTPVKEEPKSHEKQTQPSPQTNSQSSTAPQTPVGRRGRPPHSSKREKLTRNKSLNDEQSTNDSTTTTTTTTGADDVLVGSSSTKSSDERKGGHHSTTETSVVVSDKLASAKVEDVSAASSISSSSSSSDTKAIHPPEVHDDSTVENKDEDIDVSNTSGGSHDVSGSGHQSRLTAIKSEAISAGNDSSVRPSKTTTTTAAADKEPTSESIALNANNVKTEVKSSDDNLSSSSPVKDAFDFDDDEEQMMVRDEEPLKEKLNKKRKVKETDSSTATTTTTTSSGSKRSAAKNASNTEKVTVKEVVAVKNEESNSVRESGGGRSNSVSSRKSSTKKSRKAQHVVDEDKASTVTVIPNEVVVKLEEQQPIKATPTVLAAESTGDKKSSATTTTSTKTTTTTAATIPKNLHQNVGTAIVAAAVSDQNSVVVKSESKKRKGRKRKDDDIGVDISSPTPAAPPVVKKRATKPTKLELQPEEDSNLEVQKLFEQQSSTTSAAVQDMDFLPINEPSMIKVLPNFTDDINPSMITTRSGAGGGGGGGGGDESDFLLCEEAVPASPDKPNAIVDEHIDDELSLPLNDDLSPAHSYHSTPTRSPDADGVGGIGGIGGGVTSHSNKDNNAKGSGGSNSEMENETPLAKDDAHNKRLTEESSKFHPSPVHDEDSSLVLRHDHNKSPVSPKKRRRGRVRTISQSDCLPSKERTVGIKTRGSSGRHRAAAERQSPITAFEHRVPFSMTHISFNNYVPESKYNFCEPIDESVDPDRRINILQERLQELRRTYLNIKNEVTVLDRKKKKARRKEREKRDTSYRQSSSHHHHYGGGGAGFGGSDNGGYSGGPVTATRSAAMAVSSLLSAAAMSTTNCSLTSGSGGGGGLGNTTNT